LDSAEFHKKENNNYQSLIFYKKALKESRKGGDPHKIASDLVEVGGRNLGLSEMNESLENYIEALSLVEKKDCHDTMKVIVLSELTFYFIVFEDLIQAEKYLEQIHELAKVNDDSDMFYEFYKNNGVLERHNGNYEESIENYKKALAVLEQEDYEKRFVALMNLATAYSYNKEYDKSLEVLLEADELNINHIDRVFYEIAILGQLGTIYSKMGGYDTALRYFSKGLKLSEEKKNKEMMRRYNREMARMFSRQGKYKLAYKHYTTFVKQYEEYNSEQKEHVISEMNAKYQYEKKEQELIYLAEQKELEDQLYEEEISQQRTIIGYSIFAFLILLVSAIYINRTRLNKQRTQLRLKEQEKELVRQNSILAGQEAERNRLSRELHDGLGGALASIKLRLSDPREQQNLVPILLDLDQACQEVRNVSHSLNSGYIQASNFYSLLKKFAEDFQNRSGMNVQFDFLPMDELNNLSESLRHNSFRIIQELSNNAMKHSNATNFTIGLLLDENDVMLLVEDTGDGCDTTQLELSGIGLKNVEDRVSNMHGKLEIDSQVGVGMTFSIKFPYST
jgi:signal transduction histidine kinase